ncbi:two-component system, OmpR family, sensor histidine kinase RstB [Lysobacter sp. yr284]|uniref:ATP-binding protein n=1 Tax=Lysobacter sp. yr284 TaxID=1761791 RepID=UPI00089D3214|nr:ATP-binding protein [Lysobacter sp. yr284]SDY97552.1 two-component system, OmpR family, sensor histidine kinase RstB [Lysobacter sp. yr284]
MSAAAWTASLARRLWPRRPAPARHGHFGLFVRYYLIVVLIYAVVVVGGISAWLCITDENSRAYGEAQLRGTHYLIEQRYLDTPREDWPALGRELSEHFAYPVRVAPLAELRDTLTEREWLRLQRGDVVMESEDEAYTYQRLPGTDQAVALGDFDDVMVQGVPWSDLDLIDSIVILAMYFLAIALPLYFLVYRFWRDLRRLRTTAEALSAGELDARAPEVTTQLVNPLGHALNHMAGQVQQVLESQRILAQAVAHEIRTPLARMRFGLEMLEQAGGDEERAHLREGLETDIQRLEHLAAHSVAYARIGRMIGIEREPVPVTALLADLADVFEPEPPLMLSFDGGGVDCLPANREALELALRNLIANALRHARTRVAVSVAHAGDGYALQVDDDGEGVPEADRERVFQPFAQLRKHPEGFGLGLALVRVIAEKHGGHASVADSPLGGAGFRIELPAQ